MIREQEECAKRTKNFLQQYGLKSRFVCKQVEIDEQSFSKFLHSKLALSDNQLKRLASYVVEYEQRNPI